MRGSESSSVRGRKSADGGAGRKYLTMAPILIMVALLSIAAVSLPSAPVNGEATVPSWPFLGVNSRLSAVDLYWDPPTSDGGSPLTGYNLYRGLTSNELTLYQSFAPDVLSYTDEGVVNGIYYYYALGAQNAIGEGQRAGPTLAIPGDEPGPPRDFSGYALGNTAYMTWQPPEYFGGCDIVKYIVYTGQSFEGGTLYAIEDTFANVTTYSFDWRDHFSAGSTAFFKLEAHNAVGSGPFSNGIFITMPNESTAPGSPKNVDYLVGSSNVTLTWDAPDSDGGSPITGYEIYRGATIEGLALIGTSEDDVFVDDSVFPGSTYTYGVLATNSVGDGTMTTISGISVPALELYITGTVTDGNGDSISGAKVTLETAMFVLTDEEGRFNISAAPGNHTLTISYSGAATRTVLVVLGSESEDVGTVELLPEPVDQTLYYASIVLAVVVAAILLFYIYWGGKKQDEEERKAKEKK